MDKVPAPVFDRLTEDRRAENQELTSAHMLRAARQVLQNGVVTPPLPDGVFDVILADPPWQYENRMAMKSGRPRVTVRPGLNERFGTVLERIAKGEISKREAARLLGVGTATLYRYAGWTHSEKGAGSSNRRIEAG